MATKKDFIVKNGLVVTEDATASSFVKSGGTSSQFLKADGSVDSSSYLTAPRTVTAGGNTLANGETLAFTAGSNITISESGGAVTIAATAGGASAIDDLSDAITTATSNIGLGSGALDSLTASSGNYNVALGINAGTAVTTGDRNIAIGYAAGDGFDTESDNIAIGYDALGGAVAGGERNVAIGNYAGDAITSADGSTLVGYNTGTAITTGNKNTLIGHEVGRGITTGLGNTLVGSDLTSVTQGHYNVIIGYQTAGHITTGRGKIIIGNDGGSGTTNDFNRELMISNFDGIGRTRWIHGTSTGAITFNEAYTFPTADGSIGQVLTTNGSGTLTFADAGGGISDVVDDTTPQLGGDLDVNGNKITSVTNGNIVLEPNGSGQVQIGRSVYNPSGITTGKLTVTRDETEGSDTGPTLMLVDGDSDANNGPVLKMYRNTESPANGDALGSIGFNGEDSVGGERGYARIQAVADNVTSGSNSASLEFRIFANGTQTEVMQLESDAQAGAKMTLMGVSQTGAVVSGTSTANNSYLSLIEVATADHKAITASVHITDSTNSEVQTEMIVAHFDGTTVNYTTYGQIFDGAAAIGVLEATYVPVGSRMLIRFQNTQGSTATLAGSVHATLHP